MHRQRGITEHGLRPRRLDLEPIAPPTLGVRHQRVADLPELPIDFLVSHLEIGDRRLVVRAPVDDVLTAIDQALLVEIHKRLPHGVGHTLVERES